MSLPAASTAQKYLVDPVVVQQLEEREQRLHHVRLSLQGSIKQAHTWRGVSCSSREVRCSTQVASARCAARASRSQLIPYVPGPCRAAQQAHPLQQAAHGCQALLVIVALLALHKLGHQGSWEQGLWQGAQPQQQQAGHLFGGTAAGQEPGGLSAAGAAAMQRLEQEG